MTATATRDDRPTASPELTAGLPPSTIDRLRGWRPTDGLASWAITIGITALAFVLRVVGLGHPNKLMFDETYYPKDAWSLLLYGYERAWPKDANDKITAGNVDLIATADPSFVVHPPMGKWMIALGEAIFGMNSFGWRFMACVCGALLVAVVIRITRRLASSTMIGAVAGLLLTFDGLAFVMSRIGLLDIFQAFFTMTAIACVVADRFWFRSRLADWLDARGLADLGGAFGPRLWWRPWRLAAGLFWGLAIATKWNSLVVLAAFALLSLYWDVSARRLAGAGNRAWLAVLWDGIPAFVYQVVLAAGVYLLSWWGWLTNDGGWGQDKDPNRLLALLAYHKEIWAFHTGDYIKSQTHTYDADPLTWLVVGRPIGIDAVNDIEPGTQGCTAVGEKCIAVVSGIGTPLLWWAGVFCLAAAVLLWVLARDWRFGVPVVGLITTWLPWFPNSDRPVFFFYAIMIIPFTVIAVALVMGLAIGPPAPPGDRVAERRRALAATGCTVFVALVILNFAWFYPILTDEVIPRSAWQARMWFESWI
ncbi:dolichyl-phosphate-mannose--protein O-mannosyl transferase [Naumannella cuiyingiana]|uniref:Polyprenol-phosphate-mannose--protein mannosyltransferase n=1 Tax=Naumannella cuiyingiana TaxID=1347891 RepID=A0A7Z0DA32_9ACTN|nr:dolichyl-phosphate-mannose--protein O-mannosyl transferase [Naumannella cuiyingiana]